MDWQSSSRSPPSVDILFQKFTAAGGRQGAIFEEHVTAQFGAAKSAVRLLGSRICEQMAAHLGENGAVVLKWFHCQQNKRTFAGVTLSELTMKAFANQELRCGEG